MNSLDKLLRRVPVLAASALLLLAPALAGCGGSDKDSKKTAARTAPAKTTKTATAPAPRPKPKRSPAKTTTAAKPSQGGATTPSNSGGAVAPSAGATISRAEFVRRSDAICKRTDRALLRAVRPNRRQAPDVSVYTRTVIRGFLAQVRQLEGLPRPSTGPSPTAYFAAERAKVRLLSAVTKALTGNSAARLQRVAARAQRAGTRSRRLARQQGFKICGRV